jgi:membrane fusion protein (multidrug efflux system)
MYRFAAFGKLIFFVIVDLVVFQLCGCSSREQNDPSSNSAQPEAVPVEISTVERRDLPEIIHSIGTLEANERVEIRPEIAGIIRQIDFQEGQPVAAGELLFTIDDAKIRQRLQARMAALDGAQVEMRTAGRIYRRRRELLAQAVVAPETVDEVRLEFKAAQARVQRLEAEISEIKETLKDTRIRSPISGTAGERRFDAGDYVEPGDHLVTIVQTRALKLFFTVPERFMGRVGTDQTVSIKAPAFPERQFRGKVYFVGPRIQPQTRDLPIKAYVDNPDGDLRPGGFASVELTVGRRKNAPVIPEEALVPTRSGYGVFVVQDAIARWRPVKIGLRQPGIVEIREGLQSGQTVIRAGHLSVSDGSRVKVLEGAETREGQTAGR